MCDKPGEIFEGFGVGANDKRSKIYGFDKGLGNDYPLPELKHIRFIVDVDTPFLIVAVIKLLYFGIYVFKLGIHNF